MKVCVKCRAQKDPAAFYKNAKMRDGLYAECKECVLARSLKWKKDNSIRHHATSIAWNKNNATRKHATDLAWQKANPDKVRASVKKWQKAHPEKAREYHKNRSELILARMRARSLAKRNADPAAANAKVRAYSKAHPEKSAARCRRRAAVKLGLLCNCCQTPDGKASMALVYAIGRKLGLHVDHVKPLAKGGRHCLHNLQYLTPLDNMRKGAKWQEAA